MAKEVAVFRVWKDTGDVFVLFPEEPVDYHGYLCNSYQHVGQHGSAKYSTCICDSKPATPEQYADLKTELESLGYDLEIRLRASHKAWKTRMEKAKLRKDESIG